MRPGNVGRCTSLRLVFLLLALAPILAACEGDKPPLSPEQEAVFAESVDVELIIPTARNGMSYDVTRVEAPAGSRVRLVIDNSATTSPAMRHNVVVVSSSEAIERVGSRSARSAGYVADDPAVVVSTPLAGPLERQAVVFDMPPEGEYPFICTYPGHWTSMQGVLVSTPASASSS